jgi:hypothetical protein
MRYAVRGVLAIDENLAHFALASPSSLRFKASLADPKAQ